MGRLAAWFGSLANGPIADKFGRKMNMIIAVIIFVAGSSIQAGAVSTGMLFVGEFWPGTIAGYILMM
jgi:MFS family permease